MFRHTRNLAVIAFLLGSTSILNAEIRVSTDEAMKAAVKKMQPEYPPMAKQMRIGGKVEVQVTISPDGNVEDVKILSGNALLTPSVVNTVKKWKFTPFTQDGNPTTAVAALQFDFKL